MENKIQELTDKIFREGPLPDGWNAREGCPNIFELLLTYIQNTVATIPETPDYRGW